MSIRRGLRPFFRWAGSKRLLLAELLRLVPSDYRTYYEPFLGAGSLMLALQPSRARLSDALAPLVAAWHEVAREPEELVAAASAWPEDRGHYLQVRSMTPATPLEEAARFLYLNRNGYGGLWRVNAKGEFNVPWSSPKTSSTMDVENILSISKYLNDNDVTIACQDFAMTTRDVAASDLVFFDPPYSKGRPSRPFIHYNETLFDWDEQVRLSIEAQRLRRLGAHVIVANSPHPDIRALYNGFETVDISRHSSLGSHPSSNRVLAERIFISS